MAHDEHFLSRLSRVSQAEIDLALTLYRDAGLTKEVLRRLHLTEQDERVAFSLDDPTRGPFVILTRDGAFVTCLGRDMAPGALRVIERSHLDALMEKALDLRGRFEEAKRRTQKEGGLHKLVAHVHELGPNVSREEFRALSAWQGLLVEHLLRACDVTHEAVQLLVPRLSKADGPSRQLEEPLYELWRHAHAHGTFQLLLYAGEMPRVFAKLYESLAVETQVGLSAQASLGFQLGWSPLALRGLWCVGRLGKAGLAAHKRGFATAQGFTWRLMWMTGLATIAIGHSRVRGEVKKLLAPSAQDQGWDKYAKDLFAVFLDNADAMPELFAASAAKDIGTTAALNHGAEFWHDNDELQRMLTCIGGIARADADDFFFSTSDLKEHKRPFTPERAWEMVAGMKNVYASTPTRAEKTPGRNDPCHCGSGKKYKKCHGA